MQADKPCFHCGEAVPGGAPIHAVVAGNNVAVCCVGCKAVAEFIDGNDLGEFYKFRNRPLAGMELTPEIAAFAAYDADDLRRRYVCENDNGAEAIIDIGGMYCSACAWLLNSALQNHPAVRSVDINPSTRRAVIAWQINDLPFSGLLEMIGRIGFKPQPVGQDQRDPSQHVEYRQALKRLIVAAAAGMQVMMFAVALYAGEYFGIEPSVEQFLRLVSLLVALPIVFYAAVPFFRGAWRGLRAGMPGMDLPVAIAISTAFFASLRAIWLDSGDIYLDSVAMFVGLLSATRFIEMRARHRSNSFAEALSRLLPDTATRVVDGERLTIAVDRIRVGDILAIRPGDVIPADATILAGKLSLDESLLSGESLPQTRKAGAQIFAGSTNRAGSGEVRVTQTGASTNLAGIGRLLERAKADRPPVAVLADNIASYFVIGVLLIAAATGIAWMTIDSSRALEIVLATLVVTCPCALALATPAALAASAAHLASTGFLLVRSRLLDSLKRGTTMVFDKTGTLTQGKPAILATRVFGTGDDITAATCLEMAAQLESVSEHVLARAFAPSSHGSNDFYDLQPETGRGVSGYLNGMQYRIGSYDYVAEIAANGNVAECAGDATHVYLGNENDLLAVFTIGDELRTDAKETMHALRDAGFELAIASGDRANAVAHAATQLGIDDWHASLSPAGKLDVVRQYRRAGKHVIMVGDGINDAPVLAAADASIALDAGTELARASADAIALSKRLSSIVDAAVVARKTQRIIRQNLGWAIAYNLAAVPLAASGLLSPWMAALGMSLSSLFVVMNALRLRRTSKQPDTTRTTPLHGGATEGAAA